MAERTLEEMHELAESVLRDVKAHAERNARAEPCNRTTLAGARTYEPLARDVLALLAWLEQTERDLRHMRNLHDWRAKGEREARDALAQASVDDRTCDLGNQPCMKPDEKGQ